MSAQRIEVDFIARLADAWDGRGDQIFRPPHEHRALLELVFLPPELAKRLWQELTPAQRHALLFAMQRAIELGRQCAWVLGEGQGARC